MEENQEVVVSKYNSSPSPEFEMCNQVFHGEKAVVCQKRVGRRKKIKKIKLELSPSPRRYGRSSSPDKNHCKICGKGFSTKRQLCGHLKHHSSLLKGKQKSCCEECGKEFVSVKGLHGHMRCHRGENREVENDEVLLRWRKKSKRRQRVVKVPSNSWLSSLSDSFCVSQLDPEIVKVARILIMMSNNGCEDLYVNDSERKEELSSTDGLFFDDELGPEIREMDEMQCEVKSKELDDVEKNSELITSDDGLLLDGNGLKLENESGTVISDMEMEEVQSDEVKMNDAEEETELITSDGLLSDYGFKLDKGSGIVLSDIETEEVHCDEMKINDVEKETEFLTSDGLMIDAELNLDKNLETVISDTKIEEAQCHEVKLEELRMGNDILDGTEKANVHGCDFESGESSFCELNFDLNTDNSDGAIKKGKHECKSCHEVFETHQTLGGHRSGKHICGKSPMLLETGTWAKSMEADIVPDVRPNAEEHVEVNCADSSISRRIEEVIVEGSGGNDDKYKCAVCFKVFPSGQALGGHKRAHFGRKTEIKQEQSENPSCFHLSLPSAVEEEDANNHVGLKQFWSASNQKYKPLVGLLSN